MLNFFYKVTIAVFITFAYGCAVSIGLYLTTPMP